MELDLKDVHCAKHRGFVEDCATCKQARANFLPYPLREQKPLPRSFGFTDNLSEQKLSGPGRGDHRFTSESDDDDEFNLSLAAIRLLLKLIWPFRVR